YLPKPSTACCSPGPWLAPTHRLWPDRPQYGTAEYRPARWAARPPDVDLPLPCQAAGYAPESAPRARVHCGLEDTGQNLEQYPAQAPPAAQRQTLHHHESATRRPWHARQWP